MAAVHRALPGPVLLWTRRQPPQLAQVPLPGALALVPVWQPPVALVVA